MADTNKITYVSLNKLGYYDGKIKAYISNADDVLKANLEGQVEVVAKALDEEITRAKAAEATNAAAAEAAQTDVDALGAKVGTVPEGSTVMDIITNIQESAYDDTEVRGLISDLDTNKADKTQVATDIEAAVKVETDARVEAVKAVQDEVDALEGVHVTDKKALEDAIALKADQTALDEISGVANAAATKVALEEEVNRAKGEESRIEGLVTAEAERASGVEAGLEERIETMEAFWDAAQADGTDSNVIDTLKEIQDYITSDETGASEMLASIKQNADDIDALEGRATTVEGKVSTLEGEMDAVEAAVATKAESSALEAEVTRAKDAEAKALSDAKTYADEEDAKIELRVDALEAKFTGEESVDSKISTAKQEAIDAAAEAADAKDAEILAQAKKYADDEDAKIESRVDALEEASATHALASDLTALAGRVTTAEGEIDTLQTEMDAVEALAAANKAAHEANAAAIALKASQADLEAEVTRATTRENEIEAKVDAFEECTTAEIDALFA